VKAKIAILVLAIAAGAAVTAVSAASRPDAAAYALRNRMSVLAETPMHLSFERKIYAQYALEPRAADGFAAWGLLDGWLRGAGVEKGSVVYPVFKYFRIGEVRAPVTRPNPRLLELNE